MRDQIRKVNECGPEPESSNSVTPDWPFPKPKAPISRPIARSAKRIISRGQKEVMDLLCVGKTRAQISAETGLTLNCVSQHILRARKRLGAGRGFLHVAIVRYFILRNGLKLPFKTAGNVCLDAEGNQVQTSQMVAAINAVAGLGC